MGTIVQTAGMLKQVLDAEGLREPWSDGDLRSMLHHQLEATLWLDLTESGTVDGRTLRQMLEEADPPIATFGDLLFHPHPPIELLKSAKQFGKWISLTETVGVLPSQIGLAVYYGAIASALVKLGDRITTLDDARLARSLRWFLAECWVDEPMRGLFAEAVARVEPVT